MKSLSLTELANQYKSDKGTMYLEQHGYTLIYDTLFSPLKSKPITFLEMGLSIGGPEFGEHLLSRIPTDLPSIRMWTEYFDHGYVYGFDINDFSHLESEFGNFKFFQGDLSSQQDLTNMVKIIAQLEGKQDQLVYDVILDDASHASFHQQQAFSLLFPCLKPNGIYIIEDLHWQSPSYEKQLPEMPKTLDFLMQLKHLKNSSEVLSKEYLFRDEIMNFIDDIDSISFHCHQKLAVIQKSS